MKRIIVTIVVLMLAVPGISAAQSSRHDLDQRLLDAAGRGDTEAVKQLLDLGASIQARDDNRYTPLLIAVARGQVQTALDLALKRGNTEVVKALKARQRSSEAGGPGCATAVLQLVECKGNR